MFIKPSDPRLVYCGRIDFDNADAPVMVYASSYVAFRFTGSYVKVRLTNKRSCWSNRMGCIVDGVQTAVLLSEDDAEHEYLIYTDEYEKQNESSDEKTWHELMFFKRQDSADYVILHGFELEDGAGIAGSELENEKKLKLEVYGDSVSCGEVSEAGSRSQRRIFEQLVFLRLDDSEKAECEASQYFAGRNSLA